MTQRKVLLQDSGHQAFDELDATDLPAGTTPKTVKVYRKAIAYNDANVLTGQAVYTASAGEVLLDAWFQITTAWNATAIFGISLIGAGANYAQGDTFSIAGGTGGTGVVDSVDGGGAVTGISLTAGGSGYASGSARATTALTGIGVGLTVDVTVADVHGDIGTFETTMGWYALNDGVNNLPYMKNPAVNDNGSKWLSPGIGGYENASLAAQAATAAYDGAYPIVPLVFTDTTVIRYVATYDGAAGGADPAPTQGAGYVYLVIATPTDL